MNFRPFNSLVFDGETSTATVASWSPTFVHPSRSFVYANGTDVVKPLGYFPRDFNWSPTFPGPVPLVSRRVPGDVFTFPVQVSPPVPPVDPSKTEWAPLFVQPNRAIVRADGTRSIIPPVMSNIHYTTVLIADPWRGTAVPAGPDPKHGTCNRTTR